MSEYVTFDQLREELRKKPDLVKVIRCRDCREYNPELYEHISCELLGRYVEPDGFCAWGKNE